MTRQVTVQGDGRIVVAETCEPLVLKELHRPEETALLSDGSVRTTLGPGGRPHNGAMGSLRNRQAGEFDK